MIRIRIHYAKTEALRYTSNLDINRIWERYLRRAKLPLAYSQGFHPQPRTNLACPLPLGITSCAEVIDVWLDEDLTTIEIQSILEQIIQPGIEMHKIQLVDLKSPALQTRTNTAEYHALLLDQTGANEIRKRVADLLSQETILRQRRNKQYDLRPLIEHLEILPAENGDVVLFMRLAARSGATGRPDEVLAALDIQPYDARVERTTLTFMQEE